MFLATEIFFVHNNSFLWLRINTRQRVQDNNIYSIAKYSTYKYLFKKYYLLNLHTMATKNLKKSPKALDEYQEQFKKIGNRLKQLRLKAGYSAADKFAYDHDIHPAQYTRYERGVDMRVSSLINVLTAHKMTLQDFFKGLA